jgi:hypothetical protein
MCFKNLSLKYANLVEDHSLERTHGPKPALDHGPGSAFLGPNWSIYFVYNFFELLDQKSQVWTMVIRTRKAKFGQWLIGPEKPGLDHNYSDQESHIWTMVIRTRKAKFGPVDQKRQSWTMGTHSLHNIDTS